MLPWKENKCTSKETWIKSWIDVVKKKKKAYYPLKEKNDIPKQEIRVINQISLIQSISFNDSWSGEKSLSIYLILTSKKRLKVFLKNLLIFDHYLQFNVYTICKFKIPHTVLLKECQSLSIAIHVTVTVVFHCYSGKVYPCHVINYCPRRPV